MKNNNVKKPIFLFIDYISIITSPAENENVKKIMSLSTKKINKICQEKNIKLIKYN